MLCLGFYKDVFLSLHGSRIGLPAVLTLSPLDFLGLDLLPPVAEHTDQIPISEVIAMCAIDEL